jgi:prolipoprotein diacylglyceryltransferase
MVEIVIYSLLFVILFTVGFYFFKRRAKKKIGLDKTDKPPEDIYPLY